MSIRQFRPILIKSTWQLYLALMAGKRAQLRLRQYIFSNAAFRRLPKREQRFFVRLALISDDLRHLHHLILHARVSIRAARTAVENVVALHQLIFALRIYYGTLNESWEVIETGWHGTKLSRKLHTGLSTEAKQSLKALKRYFEHDNLTKRIRHNFAFHFSDEPIREALQYRSLGENDGFVTGGDQANIFYMFAENVRNRAMLLKTGNVDLNDPQQVRGAVRKLYDEGLRISENFTAFANAVMVAIAKRLNAKTQDFSSSAVADLSAVTPVIFINAKSILKIENPDANGPTPTE